MKTSSETDKWVNENQGKHFCKCGCKEIINIRRSYYWHIKGPMRYIPNFVCGHGSVGNLKISEYAKRGKESNLYKDGRYLRYGKKNMAAAHSFFGGKYKFWKSLPIEFIELYIQWKKAKEVVNGHK